mgnify:CR=1 FL=1
MGLKVKRKRALEVAEFYPLQGQWTEEDYFALPDTNRYAELSEGRLIVPPHPTDRHQRALQNLFLRLHAFVEAHRLGVIRIAPLPVRLWPGKIREPDILFMAGEHADRIGEQVYGVPNLVVEVISPGTRRTDRVEKFVEYARAGVEEYWLVDPDERSIEVYSLREGAYTLLGKFGPGQNASSALLVGFQTPVDEVLGP